MSAPIRVAGWSTGGVGRIAIAAINRRPDLELVGVWVHSNDKNGVDTGELAGFGPIGLAATNDADAILAADPQCVCYSASGPSLDASAVEDCVRFLEAGINVVTVTSPGLAASTPSPSPCSTCSGSGCRSTRPRSWPCPACRA